MPAIDSTDALLARIGQLESELAALGYSVSHDLRAPLRTIEAFSAALAEDYAEKLDEQGLDYLRRVREAAARMELQINNLLELERVSRAPLKREPVNLSGAAAAIATDLKKGDPTRAAAFLIEPGLTVEGDPQLLEIALGHVLRNAWKFTGKHSSAKIEMGREEQEGRSVFYVRDDGAGFDPQYAGRMFTPFQRFHAASDFEGTGIGLAIVQRIVHRHHGRVWAAGAVERGATIYIDLQ